MQGRQERRVTPPFTGEEDLMTIRRHGGSPPLEPVAGNGLLDRRALLGRGIVFAGAMGTGVGTSLTGAAAEPLQNDPWSLEMGSVVPAYQVPSRFEKDVVRTRSNPNNEFRNSHARTPHHLLQGTVTPNGLFFSISHSGLPDIDPARHKLVIHGLVKQPAMSFYESKTYSQILPDGKMWLFHFVQEVKSFITHPSFGQALKGPGYYEISGIAYSGNGRISKVMVSADGGKSWAQAALQAPVLPKAFTRFRMPWRWDGQPVVLQSRAWDESGEVQPLRADFVAARGQTSKPVTNPLGFPNQHYNSITSWGVDSAGGIKHVYA